MTTNLVPIERISNGNRVDRELITTYHDNGRGLPTLVISAGWRKRTNDWRSVTSYKVEEVPTPLGRGFLLHRDPKDLANEGPEAETEYQVLVNHNGQDHICTCKGYLAHGRCKHHDAMRGLLEAGHIDHPGERPAAAEPTGEAPF